MTIGDRIKQKRKELGMTQEELANKIGKTKSAICKVETDREQNMTLDRVSLFAKALNTTPAELMGWNTQKNEVIFDAKEDAELIKKYHLLTEGQKQVVTELIEQFIQKNK